MFRSYDHPQGAYLLKLQFKTLSDLHRYINLVLWQHVVCYVWVGRCSIETGCRCVCCAV